MTNIRNWLNAPSGLTRLGAGLTAVVGVVVGAILF